MRLSLTSVIPDKIYGSVLSANRNSGGVTSSKVDRDTSRRVGRIGGSLGREVLILILIVYLANRRFHKRYKQDIRYKI